MAIDGLYLNPGAMTVCLGDFAADSDATRAIICKTLRKMRIDTVRITANTTASATDTNYQTLSFYNGTTEVQSLFATGPSSGGTTITAGAWNSTSVAAAKKEIDAGSTLILRLTKTGSGMALKGLTVQLEGEVIV